MSFGQSIKPPVPIRSESVGTMTDVNAMTAAVVSFFSGGAFGALISSRTNSRIAKATRRDKAAEALWQYHYALVAFAADAGGELQDQQVSLLTADWKQVAECLRAAYPFAGYLSGRAKRRLFTRAWIDAYSDPGAEWYEKAQERHDQFSALAALLETELQWAFPQRRCDRYRGLRARLRSRKERR